MRKHILKVNEKFWPALLAGEKTAEIRSIADRDFREGHSVVMYPVDENGNRVGIPDIATFAITHVLPGGQYGIEPGYAVLSIASFGEFPKELNK